MGVDVPTVAALSIIDEQKTWDQSRKSIVTRAQYAAGLCVCVRLYCVRIDVIH